MKKNNRAFSLILAMLIVLVSSLLAITIIEYMLPFSRNIKGIENATRAYYYANSGVEKGLYFFSSRPADKIRDEFYYTQATTATGYVISTSSSGSVLPIPGKGTSEYNTDYNTISIGDPIQIAVGNNFVQRLGNLQIEFRIPEKDGVKLGNLNNIQQGYINWQLTGSKQVLYASRQSIILGDDIDSKIDIGLLTGISYDTDGKELTRRLKNVFTSSCAATNQKCILKFSVIHELETSNGMLPYLEWKIESTGVNNDKIPLRYSHINTQGKSYGFGRFLHVRYPQDTVNQALDFAVFQ